MNETQSKHKKPTVAIGYDPNAYALKDIIVSHLKGLGYIVKDFGGFMAALYYRSEFLKDDNNASNEAVYLQLRGSPQADDWMDSTRKQDYEYGTSVLADAIFGVAGVTELSIQPFRVWMSKSPIYSFEEIIPTVLFLIQDSLGLTSNEELPGSPVYLGKVKDRLSP